MVEINPKNWFSGSFWEVFPLHPLTPWLSYTPQSSAKLNILCYGMGGIYIIVINRYCCICSWQITNFQIFLCSNFCFLFLDLKNNYKHMMNSITSIHSLVFKCSFLALHAFCSFCHRRFRCDGHFTIDR